MTHNLPKNYLKSIQWLNKCDTVKMWAIFFVTVFVTYIIGAIYKWRQANKWADCIPGGDEAFFDQLPIKLLGAGPKSACDLF